MFPSGQQIHCHLARIPTHRTGLGFDFCLEGLDANSVFMCGDRLVIATQTHVVAVSRDDGEILWARPGQASTTLMAGSVMIRLSAEGDVELAGFEGFDGAVIVVVDAIDKKVETPSTQGVQVGRLR